MSKFSCHSALLYSCIETKLLKLMVEENCHNPTNISTQLKTTFVGVVLLSVEKLPQPPHQNAQSFQSNIHNPPKQHSLSLHSRIHISAQVNGDERRFQHAQAQQRGPYRHQCKLIRAACVRHQGNKCPLLTVLTDQMYITTFEPFCLQSTMTF